MYPIVFIAAVGIILNDKKAFWYIAPLSIVGTLFSLYHNMLQIGIFTESEACVAGGTSCATPTVAFSIGETGVSLELLGLLGFLAINIVLVAKAWSKFRG
jgi:disulfide bond formation protein DsbB